MTSVLVLWVCLQSGCHPVIGEQMLWTECMSTGIIKAANFINKNPQYKLRKFAYVEPRRVKGVLGRNMA